MLITKPSKTVCTGVLPGSPFDTEKYGKRSDFSCIIYIDMLQYSFSMYNLLNILALSPIQYHWHGLNEIFYVEKLMIGGDISQRSITSSVQRWVFSAKHIQLTCQSKYIMTVQCDIIRYDLRRLDKHWMSLIWHDHSLKAIFLNVAVTCSHSYLIMSLLGQYEWIQIQVS